MKKLMVSALAMSVSVCASAHSLWILGENTHEALHVDMIYGHDFPKPEVIPEKRLPIFEPPVLHAKDGQEVLVQKGEKNYHYVAKSSLKEGTYLLTAVYKPTTWSKTEDGKWHMNKTRKDLSNVVLCESAAMQGKSILQVGQDTGDYAQTVLGKGVEITPLVNANQLIVDNKIRFLLTKEGKPVSGAVVLGSYDGYGFSGHDVPMPFYAKTNKKGEFSFKATKPGLWYLTTELEEATGNQDCETAMTEVTLSFEVK